MPLTTCMVAVVLSSGLVAAPATASLVQQQPFAMRDSAGIRIVENRAPTWRAGAGWRLSERPAVEIGSEGGDTTQLLNRTWYGTRLSDGRIVLGQSSDLRMYSATGKFIRTIGRRGRGPGEFRGSPGRLERWAGDTIAVANEQFILVFSPSGDYVRSIRVPRDSMKFDPRHRAGELLPLPDGSVLFHLNVRQTDGPQNRPTGVYTRERGIVRYVPGRARLDTLGFYAALRTYWHDDGGGRGRGGPLPFAPFGTHAWAADRLYAGDMIRYEIHGFTLPRRTARGPSSDPIRLSTIIRYLKPLRPITAEDRRAWLKDIRGRTAPADRPERERHLAALKWPTTHQAFVSLVADDGGNLWVGETRAGVTRRSGTWGQDLPAVYTVFDRDGRLLGEVPAPPDVEVLEVGSDYLLGVWTNEDDVEFVRLYRLSKQ